MKNSKRNNRYYLAVSSCLLLLSLTVFIVAQKFLPTDSQCMTHMWPYSPASHYVGHSWINMAEYYYPHSSLRGNSNYKPGVEEAWTDYTYQGVISVPYSAISKLQHDPADRWWPVNPIEGGGVAAVLSIHYQTNCLNLIRKYIHRDTYDYSNEFMFNSNTTTPDRLQDQVWQCIENLRQELTCHVDQSVYLLWKDPKVALGWNEDNAVRHKCRDYDEITSWAQRNTILSLHDPMVYFPIAGTGQTD